MSGGICAPLPGKELKKRVEDLEAALLAMAEFGDEPGHPFRGNQHTDGQGGEKKDKDEKKKGLGSKLVDSVIKSGAAVARARGTAPGLF